MLISLPASSVARRLAVGCGASTLCVLLTGIIVRAQDPAITAANPTTKNAKTDIVPPTIALSAADMAPPTTVPGTAPLGMPPVAPLPNGPNLIEIHFEDVSVATLIAMIAKQGDVGIIITDDVTVNLKHVDFKDKTPEEAIKMVARAANLAWTKEDGVYYVAKDAATLPGADKAAPPAAENPGAPVAPTGSALAVDPFPALVPTAQSEDIQDDTRESHYLRVRNLSPRIIAWWIDPLHNPEPIEFAFSRKSVDNLLNQYLAKPALDPQDMNAMSGGSGIGSKIPYNPYAAAGTLNRNDVTGMSSTTAKNFVSPYTQENFQFGRGGQTGAAGRTGAAGGGGAFELPEGVDQIIAIDPQNALLVYGTEEGVRKLETIIGYLDRPLRQVEIEAQFVTVTQSSGSAFGIDWSGAQNGPFSTSITGIAPAPGPGTFTLGYVRNNFRATLRAQIQQNRAKAVSSPRVTCINNLTASLYTTVSQPIILTSAVTGLGGQTGETQTLFYITTSVGLTVTPTINNDDTITVVMQPTVQNPRLVNIGGQQIPATDNQFVNTIANVRDGDTIALGGLRTKRSTRGGSRVPILSNIPIIGQFFRENRKSDSDEDLIIFLTARILRRADDAAPVPGT